LSEDGEDVVEGHVGYGFSRGAGAVGVKDALVATDRLAFA